MLSGIRQFAKGWVAALFVAVLVVGIAITGMNTDLFGGAQSNLVARGKGVEITTSDFRRDLDRWIERQRAQSGQFVSRSELAEQGIHRQLLDQMITERAVDRIAAQAGLHASDAMVAEEIRTAPPFQSEITGAFDATRYREQLNMANFLEPEFESGLRRDITRRQLLSALSGGVRPPSSFGEFVARFQGERRTVSVAELAPSLVSAPPTPSEEQIAQAYERLRSQFATPELRVLDLVVASPADFEARVDVQEDDIRKAYDQRKRADAGEARSFVQITAPNRAAAQEAARRLAAGEDPAAIAEALDGQVLTFESVKKDSVPDSKVAEAAFSMKVGETQAVEGVLKWTALRVSGVQDAASFESLRDELRREIAAVEAKGLMSEAVDRFEDLVAEGAETQAAAAQAGLRFLTTPPINIEGATLAGEQFAQLAEGRDLLRAAFLIEATETTDFEPLGEDGAFALATIRSITPPGVRPLAEVRDQIIAGLKEQQVREAQTALADEIVQAVAQGQTFEQAVRARKVPIAAPKETIDRRAALGGSLPQLGQAIFAAEEGAVVYTPAPGAPVLLLAHVSDVIEFELAENMAMVEAARASQREALEQDFFTAFQGAALKAAQVKRNDLALAQAAGIDPEQDTQ